MRKPLFKYQPHHFEWMVKKLNEGHSRYRVAQLFTQEFKGASVGSTKVRMRTRLPSHLSPDEALQHYYDNMTTAEQAQLNRTEGIQNYWRTASDAQKIFHKKQMKKGHKRFWKRMSKEDRKKWADRLGKLGRQQREEIGRLGGLASWANASEEERKERKNNLKQEAIDYGQLRKSWIFFESPQERRRQTFGDAKRTIIGRGVGNYQRQIIIMDALKRLSSDQQIIIALRVFREQTLKELIKTTGLPQAAILEAYEDGID